MFFLTQLQKSCAPHACYSIGNRLFTSYIFHSFENISGLSLLWDGFIRSLYHDIIIWIYFYVYFKLKHHKAICFLKTVYYSQENPSKSMRMKNIASRNAIERDRVNSYNILQHQNGIMMMWFQLSSDQFLLNCMILFFTCCFCSTPPSINSSINLTLY